MSTIDVRVARLLDPRWHWLCATIEQLHAELEDDDQLTSVNVGVESGGQYLVYGVTADSPEIRRQVITDVRGAVAAVTEAARPFCIDATGPGEGP